MSSQKNLNHILGKVISMNLLRTFGIVSDDGLSVGSMVYVPSLTNGIVKVSRSVDNALMVMGQEIHGNGTLLTDETVRFAWEATKENYEKLKPIYPNLVPATEIKTSYTIKPNQVETFKQLRKLMIAVPAIVYGDDIEKAELALVHVLDGINNFVDTNGIRWEHAIFVNLETQTILEI